MSYEDQVAFLKSINHILRFGGRLVIFDSLGATLDEKEIWEGFQAETQNPRTWPKGSFFSANLKLTNDFMKLNSEQQLKVHALEDFFGHNLVMGRDWMPQPFTYKPVSELNELLTRLGFTENKCTKTEIPETKLEQVLVGGAIFNFTIMQNQIKNSNTITFYTVFNKVPSNVQELTDLYNTIQKNGELENFKLPNLK